MEKKWKILGLHLGTAENMARTIRYLPNRVHEKNVPRNEIVNLGNLNCSNSVIFKNIKYFA